MRVAAYTTGISEPSARIRLRDYIPLLLDAGIAVKEYPLPYGSQVPDNRAWFLPWVGATFGYRLSSMLSGYGADCSWVNRQFLPTYINVNSLAKKPIVLDVDDAIWMNRGGHRVKALARAAEVVVCGNSYLAEKFSAWNPHIVIAPTSIDERYIVSGNASGFSDEGIVIGWTGTSGNFRYLYSIESPLRRIFAAYRNVKLIVVADKPPHFGALPAERVEFIKWNPEAEVSAVQRMSIGLMPLEDSDWARGKCAYKMLRYMAASLPVVVSPVGMNQEILAQGEIGFGATDDSSWFDALSTLIEDRALRETMGASGVRIIKARYSAQVIGRRYIEVFRSL